MLNRAFKDITTLGERAKLESALTDMVVSDIEFDDEDEQSHLAQKRKQKPVDKTLELRDFDEHVIFLAPMQYAGLESERFCNERLNTCFGSNIHVASALQLDLFQKALIEQGAEIPMDQICELCFREEENISSAAFAYVKSHLNRNMALSNWVWSYGSVINMLQLFGCDELCTPCEDGEVWSVENSIVRDSDAGPVRVYDVIKAHDRIGMLLKLVDLSYNRHHDT